jgi:hypothetical protein
MASYAIFLATGHAIRSKSIKGDTISNYLLAASTLISLFDPIKRDARKLDQSDKICDAVTRVIREVKRFEKVPKRCEAYTIAMHRRLFETTRFVSKDCSNAANFDWNGVGLQGGNRRSEWCQDRGSGILTKIELSPIGDTKAFTLSDITFYARNKVELKLEAAMKQPDSIMHTRVCYTWQKNGDHGLYRWYSRNDKSKYLCSVQCWTRIVQRFIRLRGNNIADQPLSVYRNKSGSVRNITADICTSLMRSLAVEVYGLTKKSEIQAFSCHSLRVGACCILYATGYSGEFIQRALRWRSEAWKTYVRDLVVVTIQHNKAMSEADTMPLM